MLVGCLNDERIQRTHLLVQQANRIAFGIVGPEAVGADHFGETVGFVGRRRISAAAHLGQVDTHSRLGQLPGRFASCEPAADDLDIECHWRAE